MKLKNPVKTYQTKNSVVFSCQYHVVWCPKYRRKVLTDDVAAYLEQLIMENQEAMGYTVLDMDIQPDYVHLLIDANPMTGVGTIIKKLKYQSALALRVQFPELKSRLPSLWTRSIFVSTVGIANTVDIQNYIDAQKGV